MCNESITATVENVSREVKIKELYKSLGYHYILDNYSNPIEKKIISNHLPICGRNKNYICSCGYATQTKNKICFICNQSFKYTNLQYFDKVTQFNGLTDKDNSFVSFNLIEENVVELEYLKGRILFNCEDFSFDFEGLKKESILISFKNNELHFTSNGKKVDFISLIPNNEMNQQKYESLGFNLYKAISFLKDKPSYYKEMDYDMCRLIFTMIYHIYIVGLPESFINSINNSYEGMVTYIKGNQILSSYGQNVESFIKAIKSYKFMKLKGFDDTHTALGLHQNLVDLLINNNLLFSKYFVEFYKKLKKQNKVVLNDNFEQNKDNKEFDKMLNNIHRSLLINELLNILTLIRVDWNEYIDYLNHLENQEAINQLDGIRYHAKYIKSQVVKHKKVLNTTEEKFPINLKLKSKQVSK